MAALRDLGVDVADIRSPKKRAKKNEHRRNKKQGRRGVWTISQVQTFLYSAKSTRTYPAWCLFAISGMRRGEVAGLRWSAVDLESGLIEVEYQRTTLTGGHGIHEGDPKQGSFRPLMVGPQVLQLLRAHRDRWIIEQAMFATRGRDDWAEHDFVFTNNTSGMPYYPGHYSHQFAVLAERAGLPRIALHDLRHSVATNARPLSIDIKTTQALIGHADASTLLNVYTHLPEYQAVHAALTVMESAVLKPVEELLEMVTGSA
jgi:integrase